MSTEESFKRTPMVTKGRQLFFEKNCCGCHKIEVLSAGTHGPELSEVGKKFNPGYSELQSLATNAGLTGRRGQKK